MADESRQDPHNRVLFARSAGVSVEGVDGGLQDHRDDCPPGRTESMVKASPADPLAPRATLAAVNSATADTHTVGPLPSARGPAGLRAIHVPQRQAALATPGHPEHVNRAHSDATHVYVDDSQADRPRPELRSPPSLCCGECAEKSKDHDASEQVNRHLSGSTPRTWVGAS